MVEKEFNSLNTNNQLEIVFNELKAEVIQKNIDYNDSLQNPRGIFQKNQIDGILGRIDDKLNRIAQVGINDKTEDSIGDLIGYLVHLKIALRKKS